MLKKNCKSFIEMSSFVLALTLGAIVGYFNYNATLEGGLGLTLSASSGAANFANIFVGAHNSFRTLMRHINPNMDDVIKRHLNGLINDTQLRPQEVRDISSVIGHTPTFCMC